MTKDEALVFRQYDSDEPDFVPSMHTAFEELKSSSASSDSSLPPRESVEVRVLCLIPRENRKEKGTAADPASGEGEGWRCYTEGSRTSVSHERDLRQRFATWRW